ncbi:MAG: CDP-archaeol synthase [Candidatus Thiodiazotropha sp. (ex Monitilora ramsayi)]|nr:CDP-archaeol synthase [Candidatus Thiodiazotropha sp. (ex Monitilora ramsayi)]
MTGIELKLLILLVAANGAPILARHLLGECCTWPLDGGRKTSSGQPILGSSKTWRGIVAALLLTPAVAYLLGFEWHWGMIIGGLAMLGDIIASFVKRRLGYPPSSQAIGLDQIPESLVPLLAIAPFYPLKWWSVLIVVIAFAVVVPLLSRLFFLMGIRRRPY